MKKTITFTIVAFILLIGCKKEIKETTAEISKTEKKETTYSQKIEIAHKKAVFLKQEAVQFNAEVEFGGNVIFNAQIAISTTSDIAKITYKNGDEIYVNKEKVFVSDNLKENKGVRFHAYTWTYFFLYPYKLSDKGTIWNDAFKTEETNNAFNTAKLTFEANTGDAPDDWYVNYTNKENNQLNHVAYIVTANSSVEKAEADPHAIKYLDYNEINGVPFAANWGFYEWNTKEGLTNKIGSAKITNIQFIKDFRNNFKVPENYTAR